MGMTISSRQEISKYYEDEKVARQYVAVRFTSELNRLLHLKQVTAVQRFIDVNAPNQILEVAPGPGRLTRDIHPGGNLVCLEYNSEMIREGKENCSNGATWVQGDAFHLPFKENFDLLYTFRFVRHFHRTDRERLYSQFLRVLKPDGGLILDAVNVKVSQPLREAHPEEYPVYDKLYRAKELFEELTGAGFHSIKLHPVLKYYRWQELSQNLIGPRVKWLNGILIKGLECLPRSEGLEWIVTCRRA